jgi:glycerol-3-phosphate dehydrogenase (NAD(P)+)
MPSNSKTIAVIGAGSWGTALAKLLAESGHEVSLWIYEAELVDLMAQRRENVYYLPGIELPPMTFTHSFEEALGGAQVVVSAAPSHVTRELATMWGVFLEKDALIVSATKGIENETYLTMTQMLCQVLPSKFHPRTAALSGPSFAREVALGQPTAAVAACKDLSLAKEIQQIFSTPNFRVYANADPLGVELGGAVKNVIAIAAGVVEGLGLGQNTRAALITRGLAEISRLGERLGANPLTFMGLAGLGDLVLTCASTQSRNYTLGLQLGEGEKLYEVLSHTRTVAEGVKTAKAVVNLARTVEVEMPIAQQVYAVLYEQKEPKQAVQELMARELKEETG